MAILLPLGIERAQILKRLVLHQLHGFADIVNKVRGDHAFLAILGSSGKTGIRMNRDCVGKSELPHVNLSMERGDGARK